MAPQPQRRETRKIHLDASVVPVERALLARATAINERAGAETSISLRPALEAVAAEFRALAEELHYW